MCGCLNFAKWFGEIQITTRFIIVLNIYYLEVLHVKRPIHDLMSYGQYVHSPKKKLLACSTLKIGECSLLLLLGSWALALQTTWSAGKAYVNQWCANLNPDSDSNLDVNQLHSIKKLPQPPIFKKKKKSEEFLFGGSVNTAFLILPLVILKFAIVKARSFLFWQLYVKEK